MELLLNLTWLAISIALGALLLASRRRCEDTSATWGRSTAWLAYLVLIAMLLPVISMTDDMMAMVAPSDGEQIARRYEAAPNGQQHVTLHRVVFHVDRKVLPGLICVGRVEIVPAVREFPATPCSQILGRAPPAIA